MPKRRTITHSPHEIERRVVELAASGSVIIQHFMLQAAVSAWWNDDHDEVVHIAALADEADRIRGESR